jgi:hypothetical protein
MFQRGHGKMILRLERRESVFALATVVPHGAVLSQNE